jgi:predicted extracellular nuclease
MKRKKAISLTLVVLLISVLISVVGSLFANKNYNTKKNITVLFYNVENLFDTQNQEGKNDGEFTPEGTKNWTEERYKKKLEDISKVISSVNKNELPEIVGLCEVENRKVLEDLVTTPNLVDGAYKIEHFESPDFRGIDCALIYRPDEFEVIESRPLKITFKEEPDYTTRDILYVKGRTKNRELFHIYVNHWPSRIGGTDQTEHERVTVAGVVKAHADSALTAYTKAHILIMGDMNDEPSNKSLEDVLEAKNPGTSNAGFFNLMYPEHLDQKGTYNYRGNWNMLDNIVISGGLFDKKGFRVKENKGYIFSETWMEYKNAKGEISPNRTYGGPNYYGGVSDHFPVFFHLTRQR